MDATSTDKPFPASGRDFLNHRPRAAGLLLLVLSLLMVMTDGVFAGSTHQVPDLQRLEGRWVRTDGGYILELRNPAKDGSVQAAYFNPRSINVARAELHQKDGKLTIFVELRDRNYPGSSYTLRYLPEQDRLVGSYYHALSKQQFEVVFLRES